MMLTMLALWATFVFLLAAITLLNVFTFSLALDFDLF